jgi:hypothetical protein
VLTTQTDPPSPAPAWSVVSTLWYKYVGGATCPVMGSVFKTVVSARERTSGGFDSHTPPPKYYASLYLRIN